MPQPYAQDLRDRVLAAYDRGKQTKEIAGTFGVSPARARRVKQVRREEHRTTRLPIGGARVVEVDLEQLRRLVERQPDATIPELHARLGKDRCGESAVGMALRRLGLSFKKRRSAPPSRTGPTSPSGAGSGRTSGRRGRRRGWSSSTRLGQDQHDAPPRPRPGRRAARGQGPARPLADDHADRRAGHGRRPLLDGRGRGDQRRRVRGLRGAGARAAPPARRRGRPRQPLQSQARAGTRELVEGAGAAVLFLPPYSPDLNPIEMVFAKVKQLLRSVACRTRDALWAAMQGVLDRVSPSDSANCFRHCGYTLQLD